MRHRYGGRKLSRTSAHRAALFRNMAAALIKGDTSRWGVIKEGIRTKAQELLPHRD